MHARVAGCRLAVALVFAAQAAAVMAASGQLGGATWRWEWTERGDRTRTVADDPARYTLRFDDRNVLRVQADCNGGSGRHAAQADGAMTLSTIATTKKGCGQGSQDAAFLRDLSNVRGYRFEGDALLLDLRDGGAMRFSPAR